MLRHVHWFLICQVEIKQSGNPQSIVTWKGRVTLVCERELWMILMQWEYLNNFLHGKTFSNFWDFWSQYLVACTVCFQRIFLPLMKHVEHPWKLSAWIQKAGFWCYSCDINIACPFITSSKARFIFRSENIKETDWILRILVGSIQLVA